MMMIVVVVTGDECGPAVVHPALLPARAALLLPLQEALQVGQHNNRWDTTYCTLDFWVATCVTNKNKKRESQEEKVTLMAIFAGLPELEPPFLAGAGTGAVFWSGSGSYSYSYSTVNILFLRDPEYDYDFG